MGYRHIYWGHKVIEKADLLSHKNTNSCISFWKRHLLARRENAGLRPSWRHVFRAWLTFFYGTMELEQLHINLKRCCWCINRDGAGSGSRSPGLCSGLTQYSAQSPQRTDGEEIHLHCHTWLMWLCSPLPPLAQHPARVRCDGPAGEVLYVCCADERPFNVFQRDGKDAGDGDKQVWCKWGGHHKRDRWREIRWRVGV